MSQRVERLSQHLCTGGSMSSPITTHVLNTANGLPAQGVALRLSRKKGEDSNGTIQWETVAEHVTNHDGRLSSPLLTDRLEEGQVYEMHFETKAYFGDTKCFYPYVKIVFEIGDPSSHYHIPLLISPFGYSTYRGS